MIVVIRSEGACDGADAQNFGVQFLDPLPKILTVDGFRYFENKLPKNFFLSDAPNFSSSIGLSVMPDSFSLVCERLLCLPTRCQDAQISD